MTRSPQAMGLLNRHRYPGKFQAYNRGQANQPWINALRALLRAENTPAFCPERVGESRKRGTPGGNFIRKCVSYVIANGTCT